MATSKRTGLRLAELPAVGAARFPDNVAATQALEQIRQILNTRFGKTAEQVDRAVTWGDLVENGIVVMRQPNGQVVNVPTGGGTFNPPPPPIVDGIPPAPTGLSVSAGLGSVFLEWDRPTFNYFGYAEVFRSTVNNLATATKIGETSAWVYADLVDTGGTTYFYWVRFVSVGGKLGPFNAAQGEAGAVSLDPAYLIEVLSSDNPDALLYKIPQDTTINGVFVPAGIYVRDAYIANGSISNAKIGNAVITDAKVANLSAAKITFGEMSGDRIAANSLNANRINSASLVTTLALINDAYVGTANIDDATITTAKIVDLAVSRAKIANLAVGNAQIDNAAITTAKIADAQITNAKIADAQITTAKIANAQIVNAHIQNAQVDRLKIAGGSVTAASFYSWPAQTLPDSGQGWGVWQTVGLFMPDAGSAIVFSTLTGGLPSSFTTGGVVIPSFEGVEFGVSINGVTGISTLGRSFSSNFGGGDEGPIQTYTISPPGVVIFTGVPAGNLQLVVWIKTHAGMPFLGGGLTVMSAVR